MFVLTTFVGAGDSSERGNVCAADKRVPEFGEFLCPPVKSQQSCFRGKKKKVKSHCLRVFAVRQSAQRFTAR